MRKLILALLCVLVPLAAYAGDTNMKLSDVYPDPVDARSEATNGELRQVVVLGDDDTNANVANVDANGALSVKDYSGVTEDAAETAGGNLVGVGTVRRDTAASSAGTTGDNATLNTDATGKLWVSGTVLEDVAHSSGDQGTLAVAVRNDVLAALAGTDGDNAPLQVSADGALFTAGSVRGDVVNVASADTAVLYAAIATDGADADDVVAAVASKKIKVLGYGVWCSGATDITWQDGDATALTGTINLVANGNLHAVAPVSPIGYFVTPVANKSLALLKSAGVDCDGHITYALVD